MTEQLLMERNYSEDSEIQELETIFGEISTSENIAGLVSSSMSVEEEIIQENNEDVRTFTQDLEMLKDIFLDCAHLIFGQGSSLQTAEENIERALQDTETATENLEESEKLTKHGRGRLFDICVLVGGVGLGTLGWIGGPWIGIPTMVAGLGLSGSVVLARNKLQKEFE